VTLTTELDLGLGQCEPACEISTLEVISTTWTSDSRNSGPVAQSAPLMIFSHDWSRCTEWRCLDAVDDIDHVRSHAQLGTAGLLT